MTFRNKTRENKRKSRYDWWQCKMADVKKESMKTCREKQYQKTLDARYV